MSARRGRTQNAIRECDGSYIMAQAPNAAGGFAVIEAIEPAGGPALCDEAPAVNSGGQMISD